MDLREFTFFISALVPNSVSPFLIRETLTSARIEPCSILQSETPVYWRSREIVSTRVLASSGEDISGSVTISIRGTPQRL